MNRLIVGMDRKRGIAKHGYRPWYIPDDRAYFIKQTKTYGGNVLVGGTTFRNALKSQPLPERTTFLVTKSQQPIAGVQLVADAVTWLKSLDHQDVWVIGGASIYKQVIDAGLADELYITHIDADFECDQFFPEYEEQFRLLDKSETYEQNGFHYSYARYVPA
jgi:dihydrofolate reductase